MYTLLTIFLSICLYHIIQFIYYWVKLGSLEKILNHPKYNETLLGTFITLVLFITSITTFVGISYLITTYLP